MNKFQIEEKPAEGLLRIDPVVEKAQVRNLQSLKASRDNAQVEKKLKALEEAAGTDSNLMPFIIDAVRTYASEGEICSVLRKVFGEYHPTEIV